MIPVSLPNALAVLAAAAALVAMQERRHRAAGIAAGIAAAAGAAGLALLPVLLGTALARRRVGRVGGGLAIGLAATWPLIDRAPLVLDVSIWRLAPGLALIGPDLRGLFAATAIGAAAWLAAGCARRPASRDELNGAALLATALLPLLLPLGAETLALAAALVLAGVRPSLLPGGANDDPLPLRAVLPARRPARLPTVADAAKARDRTGV